MPPSNRHGKITIEHLNQTNKMPISFCQQGPRHDALQAKGGFGILELGVSQEALCFPDDEEKEEDEEEEDEGSSRPRAS